MKPSSEGSGFRGGFGSVADGISPPHSGLGRAPEPPWSTFSYEPRRRSARLASDWSCPNWATASSPGTGSNDGFARSAAAAF